MLGVSRPIYVNVDTPNLGFPYFSRGVPVKKTPCMYQARQFAGRRILGWSSNYGCGIQDNQVLQRP